MTAPVTLTSPLGVRSVVLAPSSAAGVVVAQRRFWRRGGWDLAGEREPMRWAAVEVLLEQGWTVEGDLDAAIHAVAVDFDKKVAESR